MSVSDQTRGGSPLATVSNGIVQLLRETYGRGPTKAKSYLNDDVVLVVLEDILTTVEKTLLDDGKEALIREVRLTYQAAESNRFKSIVEDALGRRVLTYHSQVTFNPDMAFEIFVLESQAGSHRS
ncbi:MAG TPA: Na-translocating system protein MpsC family protein [Thermoleophilaceae bacterium]|nr:Na-translocating system protein MpsC family protein [Thermoleophilaceae bacterium]